MCTKRIHSQVPNDTTPCTFDRLSIDTSINTWLTSPSTLSQQSTGPRSMSQSKLSKQSFKKSINSWSIVNQLSVDSQLSVDRLTVMYQSTLDDMAAKTSWLLTDYWLRCLSSVNQVSTEMSLRCWSNVDRGGVNWVFQLKASINTQPWIPFLHMFLKKFSKISPVEEVFMDLFLRLPDMTWHVLHM